MDEFERIMARVEIQEEPQKDLLNGCAPPNQVHPFYAGRQYIIDWVNGTGPIGVCRVIEIPVIPVSAWEDPGIPEMKITRNLRMTRHKAMGRAPYVGCPFVYTWNVGVDNLGRQVAGNDRIKYLPMERHEICDGTCFSPT